MPNTRMEDADHALAHMAPNATRSEAKEKSTHLCNGPVCNFVKEIRSSPLCLPTGACLQKVISPVGHVSPPLCNGHVCNFVKEIKHSPLCLPTGACLQKVSSPVGHVCTVGSLKWAYMHLCCKNYVFAIMWSHI